MEYHKPKILITMHYMELGGAESALLGLLQAHFPENASIDLFLYSHQGELMEFLPLDKITLLPENPYYSMLEKPISSLLKAGYWKLALGRIWAKILSRKNNEENVSHLDDISIFYFLAKTISPFLPKINPNIEYDLAISFLQPHQYLLDKVRARKKLAWVHTDYSKVFVSSKEESIWKQYDYIGAISEEVGVEIVRRFPSLNDKIFPIENILSSTFIKKRADSETINFNNEHLNLLTIGRFSFQKKMEEIPMLASRLVATFPNLKWYIIGYGDSFEEQKIKDNIEAENMCEQIILLGKKSNPYPYIKACDVYVQPSRYEGKSITVREAQILQKPVIVTAYPTASSQIIDGKDGVIVPMELDSCAEAMSAFLSDKEKQREIVAFLSTHDYGNESEINKIYSLAK